MIIIGTHKMHGQKGIRAWTRNAYDHNDELENHTTLKLKNETIINN